MLDLDLIGAIVPPDGDRVWIDGPLARAFRRAANARIVVWVDEDSRIPTQRLNVSIFARHGPPGWY